MTPDKRETSGEQAFAEAPMKPDDTEILRRMIQSIEGEVDRTHIVFIKVLGGNSRVYRIGPEDRRDLVHLKRLLLPEAAAGVVSGKGATA